jgi:hypothetical protein
MSQKNNQSQNQNTSLEDAVKASIGNYTDVSTSPWVSKNTAILVIHGMGFQKPIETIDQFGCGIINEYGKENVTVTHIVEAKGRASGQRSWFDNIIRIQKKDGGIDAPHIDIYEYYWANMTEDKADWKDISQWLNDVINNAKKFYKNNAQLGQTNGDKSIFFNSKGIFRPLTYQFTLNFVVFIYKGFAETGLFFSSFLNYIPFPGFRLIANALKNWILKSASGVLTNLLGDLVLYNVVNPRSSDYEVKRQVLDGAVNAVTYLFEKPNDSKDKLSETYYDSIIIAGHSLGSQIGFDAINRVTLLANQGLIKGVHEKENDPQKYRQNIGKQLTGFITFGSPLDKTAFFFREQLGEKEYLKGGILNDYLCFRQKDWYSISEAGDNCKVEVGKTIDVIFKETEWKNYYDNQDYVSGPLDYYYEVKNINCKFQSNILSFTHSNYWTEPRFYRDIIYTFLSK